MVTAPRTRSSVSDSGCVRDCSRFKPRPICGIDGRTYNSRCELKNARCSGRTVRVRHKGLCPVGECCLPELEQAMFLGPQVSVES